LSFTAIAWAVASLLFGTCSTVWRFSSLSEYLNIVAAAGLTVVVATGFAFVYNRMDGVARSLPPLEFLTVSAVLISARVFMRLRHARRRLPRQLRDFDERQMRKTVLLVGVGPLADLYLRSVEEFGADRVIVAGLLGLKAEQTGRKLHELTVLGSIEHAEIVLRDLVVHGVQVDEIVVATALDRLMETGRTVLRQIERSSDIRVRYLTKEMGFSHLQRRPSMATAQEPPPPQTLWAVPERALRQLADRPYWKFKRVFDIAIAALLIVVLSPLMAGIGFLVFVDLGLPLMFWQRRPGVGGRAFRCLKFRTMHPAHDASGQPVDDGVRASIVGKCLRRLRLDEMPQLLNILKGDMSLVGPRPLLPEDQPAHAKSRLLVRPGLTGWGQVCGGRDVTPLDKYALDLWYIRNASFALDTRILLKTVAIVFGGERIDHRAIQQAYQEATSQFGEPHVLDHPMRQSIEDECPLGRLPA